MADKFGFDKISKMMPQVRNNFLRGSIKLSQDEMLENFESESAHGKSWIPITYREPPPPILDLTGKMKEESISGEPVLSGNSAVLIIDPIDPSKGEGYADYHQQDGMGEPSAMPGSGDWGKNKKRAFMTQSSELDKAFKI